MRPRYTTPRRSATSVVELPLDPACTSWPVRRLARRHGLRPTLARVIAELIYTGVYTGEGR